MKNRFIILLILPFILGSGRMLAQSAVTAKENKTETGKTKVYPKFRKISLDLSAGTRGAGLGIRYRIGESNWGIRLAYSYFPIAYDAKLSVSGYKTDITLFNNFQGFQLLAEYRPAKNSRFKLIAGVSDFYIAKFRCTLTPTGQYALGNIPLNASDVGYVNALIDWSGMAPFIGFGFGSPHPKHKVGCSLGIGMYYLTEPIVKIVGTNFLAGNDQNEKWMAENMKDYRYMPVVNFHINYRFKK